MKFQTVYGIVFVLNRKRIFQYTINILNQICINKKNDVTVGLTGGSTPKEFYKWAIKKDAFTKKLLNQIIWMTSDERYVPLQSEESNFGNADRLLLTPLNIPEDKKRPWKTNLSPENAAIDYNKNFFHNHCFDLCILGMGDDCHIASIFPESPLIDQDPIQNFISIEVPEKGTRLTITPNGLRRSVQILMLVTGKSKNLALKKVFEENFNPIKKPAQLNKEWPQKVIWLIDEEAAEGLKL